MLINGARDASGLVECASPVWLLGMWAPFATARMGALSWLPDRLLPAAVAGAVFGPLNYPGGVGLQAVVFPLNRTFTITTLALIWVLAVPTLAWFARRIEV